jgi:hypothetical protein
MGTIPDFEVLLSFAGTERVYARAIHDICQANGIRTFLDEEFQHEIWGKNLVEYLDNLYRERGTYCVVLISENYRKRAYTKVERRAAFDRMIQQSGDYLLPVKIDDTWIDGLPTSTAYLDIRIQGIFGIYEILVQKIRGYNATLFIPDDVHIPRIPLGQLKAEHLSQYLLEYCRNQPVALFGAIVYDETTAEIRKLLSDQTYWDALDKISGPDFEVFALRDKEDFELERVTSLDMLTIASASRSRSRGCYYSHLLKDYFGIEETTLVYPSLVLFIVTKGEVKYSRLIPLENKTSEEYFQTFKRIFALIADVVKNQKIASRSKDPDVLWNKLKETLLEAKYTIYIQQAPLNIKDAIENLCPFVEAS